MFLPSATKLETAAAAGGTHPSGMHSCFCLILNGAEPKVDNNAILVLYRDRQKNLFELNLEKSTKNNAAKYGGVL